MLLINLESRMKNKTFWIALLGAIVLLTQQLGFDATIIIPKNYVDIINTIFLILTILGVVVDTSTPGISDKVIQDSTVQAINNEISENGQSGSDDASVTSNNKESETSADANISSNIPINTDNSIVASSNDNSTPVIDPVAIQTENEKLKATLASIQSTASRATVQA